jgi:hypothetical protein
MLTASLDHENHNRNHDFWNIRSTDIQVVRIHVELLWTPNFLYQDIYVMLFSYQSYFVRPLVYRHHSIIKIRPFLVYYLNIVITRVTWQGPHLQQKLHTHPEQLSSTKVFGVVNVARSSIFCWILYRLLYVLLLFPFEHCIVCASSISSFWVPPLYLF